MIRSESREQVEEKLEGWWFALEKRRMKTESMWVNEREPNGRVTLHGEDIKKVQD